MTASGRISSTAKMANDVVTVWFGGGCGEWKACGLPSQIIAIFFANKKGTLADPLEICFS